MTPDKHDATNTPLEHESVKAPSASDDHCEKGYAGTIAELNEAAADLDDAELERIVDQDTRIGARDAAAGELTKRHTPKEGTKESPTEETMKGDDGTTYNTNELEPEDEDEQHEKPEGTRLVAVTEAQNDIDHSNEATLERTELKAGGKKIDPSVRARGRAIPGNIEYKSSTRLNAAKAHEGDVRYIVRYVRWDEQETKRVRTYGDPEGMFETKTEANEVAKRIQKQVVKRKDGSPTTIKKYTKVNVVKQELPARILTWDKWAELRIEIRKHCLARGLALTGGDRSPERNEQVGGVRNSSHLSTRTDRWADDYAAGTNYKLLHEVADSVVKKFGRRGRLEVLVHDAGSGNHLHVGGPTDGNN